MIHPSPDAATLVEKAKPVSDPSALNLNDTITDATTIANTAAIVDQKSGASSDSQPPDHTAPTTTVTAVDGDIVSNQTNSRREVAPVRRVPGRFSRSAPIKRFIDGFENVFNGTGTGPNDRDGSVEGLVFHLRFLSRALTLHRYRLFDVYYHGQLDLQCRCLCDMVRRN